MKTVVIFGGSGFIGHHIVRRIAKTEEFIKNISLNSLIIRPGVIIGGGDQLLQRLLPIFKASKFIPLFGDGEIKLQPVYIDDIAKAVENIILISLKGFHIFELTGNEIFTYKSLYSHISKCIGVKRILVPIPYFLSKIVVLILEKISINILTSDQLNLFQTNNLPSNIDKNFQDLGIEPQDIREIIRVTVDNYS